VVVVPNKPVMFALVHNDGEVTNAMSSFLSAIKGKKRLFIELGYYGGRSLNGTDFYRLAMATDKAGLKVMPLDIQKRNSNELDFGKHLRIEPEQVYRYRNLDKRENKWEAMLHGTTSKDIIVMHPEHGKRIMEMLKIPKTNVAYFGVNTHSTYESERNLAMRELKRIQAERIARKLVRVKQKAKNPKPFFKQRKINSV